MDIQKAPRRPLRTVAWEIVQSGWVAAQNAWELLTRLWLVGPLFRLIGWLLAPSQRFGAVVVVLAGLFLVRHYDVRLSMPWDKIGFVRTNKSDSVHARLSFFQSAKATLISSSDEVKKIWKDLGEDQNRLNEGWASWVTSEQAFYFALNQGCKTAAEVKVYAKSPPKFQSPEQARVEWVAVQSYIRRLDDPIRE